MSSAGKIVRSSRGASKAGFRRSRQHSAQGQSFQQYHGVRSANAVDVLCQPSSSSWSGTIEAALGAKSNKSRVVTTMVFERFTERSIKAVMLAQQEAKGLGSTEVTTTDIFIGLVAEEGAKVGYLKSGVSLERVREVRVEMGKDAPSSEKRLAPAEVPFSLGAKRVFELALEESRTLGMNFIAPEHVALALLSNDEVAPAELLKACDFDVESAKEEALKRLQGQQESSTGSSKFSSGSGRRTPMGAGAGVGGQSGGQNGEKPALERFCTDLTELAREHKLDPVIGRELETHRLVQVLARRTKNNPVLIGEPGVGKTAAVEGLAQAIAAGTCPEFLHNKRLMSLDVGLLMAGAKERGELEKRATDLLQNVRDTEGEIVLFIDEVHTLVGAGASNKGASGGLDISNMFKPALARGELQCIGATTLDEHRKYIENDPALERRFQKVVCEEPTPEQARAILEGLRDRYERHHHVIFSDEAIDAAVNLSHRYVADRFLPDKAIDLLDEAGSRARLSVFETAKAKAERGEMPDETEAPPTREETAARWDELRSVIDAKEEASRADLFEEASLLRAREIETKNELSSTTVVPRVSEADIEAVCAAWTGIPVAKLAEGDREKLTKLDVRLKGRVIGQDDAVSAMARAVQRNACGTRDPNRPIASMLLCGPTGVGKTELAKTLSKAAFGSEDAMVRLDMSEYMERHSVSKLIGSPPGYIGYGEGGTLTEAVRRRPHTLLLLDEVEKAHPDVFNLMLQVLDDGILKDSKGRSINFSNTMIMLTSNVGSQVISKGGGGQIGFAMPEDDENNSYTRMRGLVMEELRSFFRPEFLNRLDEVVCLKPLEQMHIRSIADKMLSETAQRATEHANLAGIELTRGAMELLTTEGYDKAYGARPLRRAVARLVDDPLADAMLGGVLSEGDTALVVVDEENPLNCKVVVKAPAENNAVALPESVSASMDAAKDEIVFSSLGMEGEYLMPVLVESEVQTERA